MNFNEKLNFILEAMDSEYLRRRRARKKKYQTQDEVKIVQGIQKTGTGIAKPEEEGLYIKLDREKYDEFLRRKGEIEKSLNNLIQIIPALKNIIEIAKKMLDGDIGGRVGIIGEATILPDQRRVLEREWLAIRNNIAGMKRVLRSLRIRENINALEFFLNRNIGNLLS